MELPRQIIHLSGLLFVLLAQFTGRLPAASLFLIIAAAFLAYSEYVRRENSGGLLDKLEGRIRGLAMRFERPDVSRSFIGAFWFYFGCSSAFFLFPLPVASASCSWVPGLRWQVRLRAVLLSCFRGSGRCKGLRGGAGWMTTCLYP